MSVATARPTDLPEVLVIEPTVYEDDRGHFYEAYNRRDFAELTGIDADFVQDNHSRSVHHVVRGLHYQLPRPQGKLVRVVAGEVWDVAVDIRRSSPTFGRWVGLELTAANRRQLWIPSGFAHGFLTLSEHADVVYKATELFHAEYDRAIRFDDAELGIAWPLDGDDPILSVKDAAAPSLRAAELFD